MLLMLMQVCLMAGLEIFKVSCKSVMDGICMAARTPEVITMRRAMDQPFAQILSISSWYLLVLARIFSGEIGHCNR
jgi:hypothetical protein